MPTSYSKVGLKKEEKCPWEAHRFALPGVMDCLWGRVHSNLRVCIEYGDYLTGIPWEHEKNYGYISQSTGRVPIPILVHNSRSMGGQSILVKNIVSITPANKSYHIATFWEHPLYTTGLFPHNDMSLFRQYIGFHHIRFDASSKTIRKALVTFR